MLGFEYYVFHGTSVLEHSVVGGWVRGWVSLLVGVSMIRGWVCRWGGWVDRFVRELMLSKVHVGSGPVIF